MPLKSGYSRETVAHNIALLRSEGYPEGQAVAASLENARKSYFKRFPQGALPNYLKYPDGRRMQRKPNPCGCRQSNPAPWPSIDAMARELVKVYYAHGEPAACELFDRMSLHYDLMRRDENNLKREFNRLINERRPNPVPESTRSIKRSKEARIKAAQDIYTRFTGHDATEVVEVDMPPVHDVLSVIGDIDGVLYTTVRDGQVEKYIHKFKKQSRPLFCVSPDGKQLYMLGGSYDFTERGIVDRS